MNKLIVILSLFITCLLQGQTIYEHDLDDNRLKELKQNIRHLSDKPERWTYDSEKEYNDAITKSQRGDTGGSDNGAGIREGSGGGNGRDAIQNEEGYQSPEIQPETENFDPNFDLPKVNLGPLGQVVLYILLGGILAALIYFLFISSSYKSNGAKYVPLDLDETAPADIPKTELERLLEEAIKAKDYRKAIRIYYLFILKDLSEKEWISWEKQKTNMHYLLEMQDKNEAAAFEKSLTYFEFIWYGKREITEAQFFRIQPSFIKLLTSLNIK